MAAFNKTLLQILLVAAIIGVILTYKMYTGSYHLDRVIGGVQFFDVQRSRDNRSETLVASKDNRSETLVASKDNRSETLVASKDNRSETPVAAGVKGPWDKIGPFVCKTPNTRCLRGQKERILRLLQNGLVSVTPPSSSEEWEFPLAVEKTLFRHEPLKDHLKAGNSATSKVEIIGRKNGYRKGDNITVMVTISDGYKQPCKQGGDQVRVWMVNRNIGGSLATEVDDLGNGSYVAVLPLPWSGKTIIKASLAYNLAVQRVFYYTRYVMGGTRYLGSAFIANSTGEITLCSPFRKIIRYSKVCDFTKENGGMPWFCGHPTDKTLSCRDWKLNFDFDFVKPLPSTRAEDFWWSEIRKANLISPTISISIGEETNKKTMNIPACNEIPWKDTWKSKAPRGYFMRGEWIPTVCSYKSLTKDEINKCLQNTTVLNLGDSNVISTFSHLESRTGCERPKTIKPVLWHERKSCSNKNLAIYWQSHAIPFHTGSHDGLTWTNQKAVNKYIDEIPADGRYLVIIHLFIHFTAYRDELFLKNIRAVRISVENLFKRNPQAKIVIRGPHMLRQYWFPPNGGDITVPLYTKYLQDEFERLQDSVLFIQPWDMTVAIENKGIHPPDHVTKAVMDTLLGHVCL